MKKSKRSFVSLLLTALMLLTACGSHQQSSTTSASAAPPSSESKTAATQPLTSTALPETTAPATSAASEAAPTEPAVERSGDIVILYTSDIHCGVDQGIGYAGLEQIRSYLLSQGDEVILVDDGDNIQGEPIGIMTKGEALLDLMNDMGYSVAIPGNHEFDYGMDTFLALAEKAEFDYISCNFNYKGELVFKPYVIRELAGRKLAFVGVTTPTTIRSSTPKYFQDETGAYVYGFLQDETGEAVYQAVQNAVDSARAEGAEYVVLMGHLGNEAECIPWTYMDVISHTNGIDVMLDGHSHDTDQVRMNNKDGQEVLRSACGTKLSAIGYCRLSKEGKLSTGLYNWNNDVPASRLFGLENNMSLAVARAAEKLDGELKKVVAQAQTDLTIYDPVEKDMNDKPIRMVRRAETNLGDLCADALRDQTGADIAVINGGGVRAELKAGEITREDLLKVHPFSNSLCVMEVKGQMILDALEWSSREVPGEFGGFLQVSGMSYEIHSYIDSSCQSDKDGNFTGISGERRVKNVMVGDAPLDPEKTYTLAGTNYTLVEKGDGFTMFKDCPLLLDGSKQDIQTLIDYITETLGGVIGAEYENPFGQGRILIIDTAP